MKTDAVVDDWLALLTFSVQQAGQSWVDLLVDQSAGDFSLIPALESFDPVVTWGSLYQGLPEEVASSEAPLLIRLHLDDAVHRQWLSEVLLQLGRTPALLVLISGWPFSRLSAWLTQCLDAACSDQPGILRFFDNRLFPLLFTHVLTPAQQQWLLLPAIQWSWRDLSGDLQWKKGEAASETDALTRINLDDGQLETLLCASDAWNMLDTTGLKPYAMLPRQQIFDLCYAGMLDATNQQILLESERERFALEYIRQQVRNSVA